MTKQRQLIFDIIQKSPEHMNAEQIYDKAKILMPSIAVGTVYRNLNLMTDARQIRRIEIPGSPDRYDKNLIPHEHEICICCGKLTDLSVPGLEKTIRSAAGDSLVFYELTVQYVCEDCKVHNKNIV